jgi:hypothetical protein
VTATSKFTHFTVQIGFGRACNIKVCALTSDLMWSKHVPLSNSWSSHFLCFMVSVPPSCFPDGIPPMLKDDENVVGMNLYNRKVSEFDIGQSGENRVKLRSDTFPCFKTETILSQSGESKLTKTKTGTGKRCTPFPVLSVANCLPITLRQTIPLLETDIFTYQFHRTCLSQNHSSPDIVT